MGSFGRTALNAVLVVLCGIALPPVLYITHVIAWGDRRDGFWAATQLLDSVLPRKKGSIALDVVRLTESSSWGEWQARHGFDAPVSPQQVTTIDFHSLRSSLGKWIVFSMITVNGIRKTFSSGTIPMLDLSRPVLLKGLLEKKTNGSLIPAWDLAWLASAPQGEVCGRMVAEWTFVNPN
jgi:hypothetical protein